VCFINYGSTTRESWTRTSYRILRPTDTSESFNRLRPSAVLSAYEPTFRINISPPSSESKISRARNQRARQLKSYKHFSLNVIEIPYYKVSHSIYTAIKLFTRLSKIYIEIYILFFSSYLKGPSLWSSSQSTWLQTQRSRVRFPALPNFLSSSGSGTGSTQPLRG
jgi:hypothetical protein